VLAASQRVCLLDLDHCKGDVGAFLDLRSGRSVTALLDQLGQADEVLVHGAVEQHPSGLHVLAQPYDLTELKDLSSAEVAALITLLRGLYQVVLIDVGSRVDVVSLAAAQVADKVVLVTTPDVPALRDARRVAGLLHRLEVPVARLALVLNKLHPRSPVSEAEVRQQFELELVSVLPRDNDACRKADLRALLLADVAPRSPLTHELTALWGHLHGETRQAANRAWFWGAR
jgi:Flp pilus assembly CpaE family ATPase